MYKMFLYIIIGVTTLNTTSYITFVFLLIKTVDDYCWALDIIQKLYKFFDILDSKVIITNAKLSIICSI